MNLTRNVSNSSTNRIAYRDQQTPWHRIHSTDWQWKSIETPLETEPQHARIEQVDRVDFTQGLQDRHAFSFRLIYFRHTIVRLA